MPALVGRCDQRAEGRTSVLLQARHEFCGVVNLERNDRSMPHAERSTSKSRSLIATLTPVAARSVMVAWEKRNATSGEIVGLCGELCSLLHSLVHGDGRSKDRSEATQDMSSETRSANRTCRAFVLVVFLI